MARYAYRVMELRLDDPHPEIAKQGQLLDEEHPGWRVIAVLDSARLVITGGSSPGASWVIAVLAEREIRSAGEITGWGGTGPGIVTDRR